MDWVVGIFGRNDMRNLLERLRGGKGGGNARGTGARAQRKQYTRIAVRYTVSHYWINPLEVLKQS